MLTGFFSDAAVGTDDGSRREGGDRRSRGPPGRHHPQGGGHDDAKGQGQAQAAHERQRGQGESGETGGAGGRRAPEGAAAGRVGGLDGEVAPHTDHDRQEGRQPEGEIRPGQAEHTERHGRGGQRRYERREAPQTPGPGGEDEGRGEEATTALFEVLERNRA